jgi:hypothetical protein
LAQVGHQAHCARDRGCELLPQRSLLRLQRIELLLQPASAQPLGDGVDQVRKLAFHLGQPRT